LDGYRAVEFDWRNGGNHDVGVMAQELQSIFPELVNTGSTQGDITNAADPGVWSVQYSKLGALALQAKNKDLLYTQHKEAIERKNELVDNMKKRIEDPMTVLSTDLKKEMLYALQLSRYKPAWEAIDFGLVMSLKRKKLEAGWKEDMPDFDIKERLKDNETQLAIDEIDKVIKKLSSFSN